MPAPSPLRLGLIGAGAWGKKCIATIGELPDTVLARVGSGNPETRALVPPTCAVSAEWRDVAGAKDLDGLLIASPPPLHYPMAKLAIEKGLPVLIEKPLTLDFDEAKELLALAEREGSIVRVNHIHLHNRAYGELKRRAETLGPPRLIVSEGGSWGPFRAEAPGIWDYGAHDISMILDLLGEAPRKVQAEMEARQKLREGPGESARLTLDFPSGCQARVHVGNLFKEKRRRLEVHFEKEVLIYEDHPKARLTRRTLSPGSPGQEEELPFRWEPPLKLAITAFIEAVRSGDRSPQSLRLGAAVVEVLTACEKIYN